MTRPASLKYTTVEVWVTPDMAPVWVNSMAGNGATDDNRPPLSRIRAGSMRDPTLRTSMVPSALHANRVTTRWPNELLGRTVGRPSSITGSLNESLVLDNGVPFLDGQRSGAGRFRIHGTGSRPWESGAGPPSQFAPAMKSAALAPITMLGAWVCPRMMVGITDASATRSPCTPRTSSRGVTTLAGSVPIRQVPTG